MRDPGKNETTKVWTWRRALSILLTAATLAAAGAWVLWLRPTSLGGSAGYISLAGTSMEPTFHTGDLVLTRKADSYEIGDVVAYPVPQGQPGAGVLIIHRIVGGSATDGYILQGDNRDSVDLWRPKAEDIVGREWVHLPGVARWLSPLRSPVAVAVFAGVLACIAVVTHRPKDRRRTASDGSSG